MTEQTPFTKQQLTDALYEVESLGESSVYASYSGRCMYGDTCFGVVTDDPSMVAFAIIHAIHESDPDGDMEDHVYAAQDIVRRASHDSMGRSSIVYFPGWNLPESDDDDGDLDDEQQEEVEDLSTEERGDYFRARDRGLSHDDAIAAALNGMEV